MITQDQIYGIAAVLLFCLGLHGVVARPDILRKIIALNLMGAGVFLYFVSVAQRYLLGGWPVPLGINLHADGLSLIMLLMTATVATLITVYAAAYLRGRPEQRFLWPLWLFLWAGLNALYLSGDLFNLYVVLEIAGLSAVALAALAGNRAALTAALRYLLAAMVGSLSYLLGVGLIYSEYGVLDLATLAGVLRPGLTTSVAFGLMMLGLLMKTALFPLHFWLPPAHSAALAPVSAALSALVIKGSFYQALSHGFAKASMFLAAGVIVSAAGSGGSSPRSMRSVIWRARRIARDFSDSLACA
jgi:multicomponent Na+:H+ antiporter subunit D